MSKLVSSLTAAAFLVAAFFFSGALLAQGVPAAPTQWVTDTAGILNESERSALNEKLRTFEERSGAQFIVYIAPTVPGGSLEDFTIRAATKWRAGQKKYDNGLILFVFPKDRDLRIEVGYGLEGTLTDSFSSRVIRDVIVPAFQRNDYPGGLNAGADALIAQIEGKEAAVPVAQQPQGASRGLPFSPSTIFFLLILFFVIIPALSGRRGACCWLPFLPMGGGTTFGGGGFSGGFGGGGFGGGGGWSGGGGGFGGGGASGSW